MNKRINDLTEKQILDSTDLFIVESNSGTKKIQYSNLILNTSHNNIFRGKNLGTITSSNIDQFMLDHEISTGKFTDLYVGDYFTANYDGTNKIFRIAGFDTYFNQVDAASICRYHHLVIVPDNYLEPANMNSTDTTGISQNPNNPVGISASPENQLGAFAGSDMFQLVLPEVNTKLEAIFGNHLLSYRHILPKSIDKYAASGGMSTLLGISNTREWFDIKAILMSEMELYGTRIWSSSGFDSGSSLHQLPLFRLEPRFTILLNNNARNAYWLRDVCRSISFVYISAYGQPAPYPPQSGKNIFVRPKFLLG